MTKTKTKAKTGQHFQQAGKEWTGAKRKLGKALKEAAAGVGQEAGALATFVNSGQGGRVVSRAVSTIIKAYQDNRQEQAKK